jgi:hypothetical protein
MHTLPEWQLHIRMHSRGAEEEGDSARRDMDFLVKVVEINDNSRIEQS